MRVCLIASHDHPVREPFAGGLESFTHGLARELAARGHEVTLFAGSGVDPALPVRTLTPESFAPSAMALRDVHSPSREWLTQHHAYLALMLRLGPSGDLADRFDLVHNTSLHHLPVAMAASACAPVLTTLHTPPLPWLESALALHPPSRRVSFTAVSAFTARSWAHAVDSVVIHNGVDPAAWSPGPGGQGAVWAGRMTAEKAPHEAIDACRRAAMPLTLAGPIHDPDYWQRLVVPRLGDDVRYLGHLSNTDLARVYAAATVAIVTPAWDEPYGLVAAEAMACGTPVAGYARGGLTEVVGPAGVLVAPGDEESLSAAIRRAALLDRPAVRHHAETSCSLQRMVDGYESVYAGLTCHGTAA